MQQLNLFPPLAVPSKPLPDDAQNDARNLLSDLLVAVLTAGSLNQHLHEEKQEKTSDEQDCKASP